MITNNPVLPPAATNPAHKPTGNPLPPVPVHNTVPPIGQTAQKVLSQQPSSEPKPVTENHKFSWIKNIWEKIKGGPSAFAAAIRSGPEAIKGLFSHPMFKTAVFGFVLVACSVAFIAMAAFPPASVSLFAVAAFGLVAGIVVSLFGITNSLLPNKEDSEKDDKAKIELKKNNTSEANVQPPAATEPKTLNEVVAKIVQKKQQIANLTSEKNACEAKKKALTQEIAKHQKALELANQAALEAQSKLPAGTSIDDNILLNLETLTEKSKTLNDALRLEQSKLDSAVNSLNAASLECQNLETLKARLAKEVQQRLVGPKPVVPQPAPQGIAAQPQVGIA